MTEENSNINLRATALDVGKPDSTQNMPAFDTGPAIDSLTPEQGVREYGELTLDKDGKFSSWPRSAVIGRREELFKKFIFPKIQQQQQKQKEDNTKWLGDENERIEERDARMDSAKAKQEIHFYFGGEKAGDVAIEAAQEVFREVGSDADEEFFGNSGLGNNPRIVEIIGNLKGHSELYPVIKEIGLKNLIQIGSIALKRRKR